jgi:hypothetical protein
LNQGAAGSAPHSRCLAVNSSYAGNWVMTV